MAVTICDSYNCSLVCWKGSFWEGTQQGTIRAGRRRSDWRADMPLP
ncbi:hypothetical protein LEMLEM_LOCUS13310 [Lemmus lemmus]